MAVLDNHSYYGQKDDLTLRSSFPDKKGKFHIEGRLVMTSKHLLHPFMKEIAKVMTCCGAHQKYLMGPFPRYLLCRCCEDKAHIKNLEEEEYISYIIDGCRDTARAARELALTCGIRKSPIINPLIMMVGDEEVVAELDREALAMFWDDDPVHPNTSSYDTIAEKFRDMAVTENKPPPPASNRSVPAKRPRVDRADWINTDNSGVVYAPPSYRGQWPRQRGGRRPFRGWRGR
jgi:hypothetical protein